MLLLCEIFDADNRGQLRPWSPEHMRGLQLDALDEFWSTPEGKRCPFSIRENVRMTSSLDLNLNILQIQGCSVPELFLQLISNECDTFK